MTYHHELKVGGNGTRQKSKNIGWLAGRLFINVARKLGAKKIFFGSNTILEPISTFVATN